MPIFTEQRWVVYCSIRQSRNTCLEVSDQSRYMIQVIPKTSLWRIVNWIEAAFDFFHANFYSTPACFHNFSCVFTPSFKDIHTFRQIQRRVKQYIEYWLWVLTMGIFSFDQALFRIKSVPFQLFFYQFEKSYFVGRPYY